MNAWLDLPGFEEAVAHVVEGSVQRAGNRVRARGDRAAASEVGLATPRGGLRMTGGAGVRLDLQVDELPPLPAAVRWRVPQRHRVGDQRGRLQ